MKKKELFARDSKDHQTFCNDLVASLLGEDNFHDVTLASLDGQQIFAHRAVLSYSSSLLNTILQQNKERNPLIFCRGVNYQEIKSMLEFIYLGRTAVPSKELQNFLGILRDFGVRGVREMKTEGEEADNDNEDLEEKLLEAIREDNGPLKSEWDSREEHPSIESNQPGSVTAPRQEEQRVESSHRNVTDEIVIKEESFYSHINQRIVDPRLSRLGNFQQEGELYLCDLCDYKTNHKKQVLMHKITVHVKLKFECDICENSFSDPRSLRKHKTVRHVGVKYECDQCDRSTATAYSLATHRRRKHSV